MPEGARGDRARRITMPAAAPSGSSHCRHVTAGACPRGQGSDLRIAILLFTTKTNRRSAGFSGTGLGSVRPASDTWELSPKVPIKLTGLLVRSVPSGRGQDARSHQDPQDGSRNVGDRVG